MGVYSMDPRFDSVNHLVEVVKKNIGKVNKATLTEMLTKEFNLTKDRSVFYCDSFAIRVSSSQTKSFSNTVLSLSNLKKVDDRPFIVCLVMPNDISLFLANSTFLKKISHSSQEFRVNNIKGSFNGSDILRDFQGYANIPENFQALYKIHESIGFDGNLTRLVDATNDIAPKGVRFEPDQTQLRNIMSAPERAKSFCVSQNYGQLKDDLDARVEKYKKEILLASLIDNVNVRGRAIEYIISGEDELLRREIIDAITHGHKNIPAFKTENDLGDYSKEFENFSTETDVKTKIMVLDSNPKAYNLDKILEFLSKEKSVFLIYFIGVDRERLIEPVLVSMFQEDLVKGTILLKHWAGRNSRGVSQFDGRVIKRLILEPSTSINYNQSIEFLESILSY